MYADSYSCKRQDASLLDLRVGGGAELWAGFMCIVMGRDFTSGGQLQLCAKYRLVNAMLSPYH